ncbi:MAG: hydratase [Alphaproteobacteria bacterium]|nr:hydratase [Alphaproteobacteria bacterium]
MTMGSAEIEGAAATLLRMRRDRQAIGFLPGPMRPRSELDAYAIQEAVHRQQAGDQGGRLAGFKIGCTTPTMQHFVGVDHPCYGGILAGRIMRGPAKLRHGDFLRVGCECEIAVRLGRDLGPGGGPFTAANVADHVAACMASIEIVDDRYQDYHGLDAAALIADDFFQWGCVLGPENTDWRALDLVAIRARTIVNGKAVGEGRGADVLGHPFAALAWLAGALAARGRGIPAGAIVQTGSMVRAHMAAPGEHVVIAVDGLGEASVTFG